MNNKIKFIIPFTAGLALLTGSAAFVLGTGRFKQNDRVYTYVDYDLNEDTGFVVTAVEGQRITISPDKIVSLPTDYESGNALYVSEYKTFFFTQTVYDVDRFVILIPTDGHGDDWKLGV